MGARVFGLETEYALSFVPEDGQAAPAVADLFGALAKLAGGAGFLPNGSRFYLDGGQAEWATPECRSAREAAVFDAAADAFLTARRDQAEAALGRRGRLLVVKNNVDGAGHTYGSHENYMTPRRTEWLDEEDHLRLTARALVPFLTTRQLIAGAGRVGYGPKAQDGGGFQLSQRADFLSEVVSPGTQNDRAIFCLSRGLKESLGGQDNRRLHLILGDSNLSPWATWMKLGTTGLVLRLIEELGLDEVPHLADPVAALRAISRDPACAVAVPLRDGRRLSAVEIQRVYWRQAEAHLSGRASDEERQILREWGRALDALGRDPQTLFGLVDWVTKKRVFDRFLEQRGATWADVAPGGGLFFDLARMDIQFHELSEDGLYQRLRSAMPADLLDAAAVARAVEEPPPFTRAWLRGMTLRHGPGRVVWSSWDRAALDGRGIPVPDPLLLDAPAELAGLVPPDFQARRLAEASQSPDAEVRAWAAARVGGALAAGAIAADRAEAREVRLAALGVLAKEGGEEARAALVGVARDRREDAAVRWRAEELLEAPASAGESPEAATARRGDAAEAPAPPPAAPAEPADNGSSPLVQLLD